MAEEKEFLIHILWHFNWRWCKKNCDCDCQSEASQLPKAETDAPGRMKSNRARRNNDTLQPVSKRKRGSKNGNSSTIPN